MRARLLLFAHLLFAHLLFALLLSPLAGAADSGERVVYGTDDRHDWYEETHPERVALARSTCALLYGRISQNPDDTWTLANSTIGSVYVEPLGVVPLCASEPYRNQPAPSFCSAFLVSADIVASAGHCYRDLGNAKIVFNFYMIDASTPRLVVDNRDVYTPTELIGRILDNPSGEDWMLLRLDRPVTSPGAVPLPIRRSGEIEIGDKVGAIGHPLGLPNKIAWGDNTVVREFSRETQFIANLDAYGGNSGSAIFNQATGIVEGIVIGGDEDFVLNGECAVSKVNADDGGPGEGVVKSTLMGFQSLIPLASPSGPPVLDDSSDGDGDGLIEWDDTSFAIRFPVRNVGEATLTGVTALFSSPTPDVIADDVATTYPAISAGETSDPMLPFTFSIDPAHEFGAPIPVSISLMLPDDGGTRDYDYLLTTEPRRFSAHLALR